MIKAFTENGCFVTFRFEISDVRECEMMRLGIAKVADGDPKNQVYAYVDVVRSMMRYCNPEPNSRLTTFGPSQMLDVNIVNSLDFKFIPHDKFVFIQVSINGVYLLEHEVTLAIGTVVSTKESFSSD